jgi:hypothetical protein
LLQNEGRGIVGFVKKNHVFHDDYIFIDAYLDINIFLLSVNLDIFLL